MPHSEYAVKVCMCLKCGHMFERSSNITGKGPPKPGDYSLCIRCGVLLKFNQDMSVSLVNEEAAFASMTFGQRQMFMRLRLAIKLARPSLSDIKRTVH